MAPPGRRWPVRRLGAKLEAARNTARALILAAAITTALGLLPAQPALAQQTGTQAESQARQTFNIPAGSLTAALNALARQAGLALTFDPGLTQGITTEGLSGEFTPQQALQQLLAGTGLAYRFSDGDTVTLVAQSGDGLQRLAPIQVTASRVERSVSTIPGSVTVIDAEELDQQRQVTSDVQRILQQSVPGFRGATGNRSEGGNALRGRTALILQERCAAICPTPNLRSGHQQH